MQISIANAIQVARRIGAAAAEIITTNLKMWLGFETSVANQEQVVNGDFSDGATGWLIEDGWNVTNNRLNVDTDDGNLFARQNSILEVGKTYVLTLDVSLDVGQIKFESGGSPNFIITTSDTTITHTFVATLADVIFRRNVVSTRGYIDNISVKLLNQITPDKSGNNNVGELFTGKALEFDGNLDSVTFTSYPTSIKSVVFWYKPLASQQFDSIIWLGGSRNGTIGIQNNYGTINCTNLSGKVIYVNGVQTASVTLNQWQRVVINFPSKTLLDLGFGRIGANYGDCQLSDIQFYNENLSLDDIAYDYANPQNLLTDREGSSVVLADLRGYWALSEGAGSIVYDSSGGNHNGTISGATYEPAQPRIPQLGMMNWSKGSNLYLFSEDFENSNWLKNTGTTITNNYATSPNGDLTAARYLGTGFSGVYDTFTLNTNSYTLSFYVKSNTGQNQNCRLIVDSVVSSNLSVTTDWSRISYTQNGSGNPGRTNGIFRDAGNSDIDILIWGAQLEESSSASAYRLTDGATTLNSTVIANPSIPTQDILGNAVRDRLNSFNLGKFGGARVYDFTLSGNQATIQLWFKNINSNDSLYLADIHSATDRIVLGFNSSQLSVYHEITGSWQNFGVITDGDWNFATFTFDGTTLKCFVGTSQLGVTKTITAINIGTTEQFGIGMNHYFPTRTQDYNGHISDFLIYDRVLTSGEIQKNYNAGLSAHTND